MFYLGRVQGSSAAVWTPNKNTQHAAVGSELWMGCERWKGQC